MIQVGKVNSPKSRKIIVALVVIILIIGALVVVFVTLRKKEESKPTAVVKNNIACTIDNKMTIVQAIGFIERTNPEKLAYTAEAIKKIEGFDTDQNCLAVLVFDSLGKGDIDGAQAYLDKIKPIYKSDVDMGVGNLYTSNPDKLAEFVTKNREFIEQTEKMRKESNGGSEGADQ